MIKNISRIESILRMIIGSLLFYFFIIGGPLWTLVGLYFILSSSFRFCIFYFYTRP